jgi:hypothetical protein
LIELYQSLLRPPRATQSTRVTPLAHEVPHVG